MAIPLHDKYLSSLPSYEEALEFYTEALGSSPTNIPLWKRKVAVHKARGDTTEAIKELSKLLEV